MGTTRDRDWLWAALICLPVVLFYVAHWAFAPPGFNGTGFVQYDQLYYMANAREIVDRGGWFTYGNPFSPDPATQAIYFQPVTAVLALLLRLTGADPAALFLVLGVGATLGCARSIIALFRSVVPERDASAAIGLVLFAWGSGLLVLASLVVGKLVGVYDPIRFDPEGGFWFLSLGRNLLFPLEAFHHLLFFGAVLLAIRQKWAAVVACAAVLSISHPFTGIELLGILFGWAVFERFFISNRTIPAWFIAAMFVLMVAHAGYYLAFLPRDPEHRELFAQWRDFQASASVLTTLLAYGPVALFAVLRVVSDGVFATFAKPRERLLLLWFAGAFVLSNNHLFMDPIQPLHFSRGYVWTPLFLLGAPLLVRELRKSLANARGKVSALLFAALMLLDNIVWLGVTVPEPMGIYLTTDERRFLDWLDKPENSTALLLSDRHLAYAATAYSPVRGWYTHVFNTPSNHLRKAELRAFLDTGAMAPGMEGRTLIVVRDAARSDNPRVLPAGAEQAYQSGGITAWRVAGSPEQ